MTREEAMRAIEELAGASGTSGMRAAAAVITNSLDKKEHVEGEEQKIAEAITNLAKESGIESSLLAAMMMHGLVEQYYETNLRLARREMQFDGVDVSQMQKVGNC